MRRRFAAAALALALSATPAAANGRFPSSVSVHSGGEDTIAVAATFGLLLSKDKGQSFHWICEEAIGYGGVFDPDWAIADDGRIFATTFSGLRVTEDGGCTWNKVGGAIPDNAWVGAVSIGSDGRVWAATSSGGLPNDVFATNSAGVFESVGLQDSALWWKSVEIAATNPQRVFVTGYSVGTPAGPTVRMVRSDNGGQDWNEIATDDFSFGDEPQLFVVGISPINPDIVFAQVPGAVEPVGDTLYRSLDAGANWELVYTARDKITAFTIRADGQQVVVGTINDGVHISANGGAAGSFVASTQQPKMACVTEADGELLSCGANWEPDLFALGRSSDGQSWEKSLRFQEIAGPLECPAGTPQRDICVTRRWATVCEQFQICEGTVDAGPSLSVDASVERPRPNGSGCGCSAAFLVVVLLPWRRR